VITSVNCYISTDTNPYANLAVEECLLRLAAPGELILYLWQNDNTVVIGRNQNCLRECNVAKFEADGGRLSRRITGGGAMYQDMGNQNFSFITTRGDYDEDAQTSVVLNAVRSLGVDAVKSGRNDLTIDGCKFSGSAYSHGANSLRHGTLLVATDIGKMAAYLGAPGSKLESKGVKSVPSRVANLSAFNSRITTTAVRDALITGAVAAFNARVFMTDEGCIDKNFYISAYERHQSREWIIGDAFDGDYRLYERFNWGDIELLFTLKDGVVARCAAYSDALDTDPVTLLPCMFTGLPFTRAALVAAAERALSGYNAMAADITALINTSVPDNGE